MRARIEKGPNGYRFVIRCESGYPIPVERAEEVEEVPLGLFQLWDGDGLLLSTWAAASVYVFRAHLLTPRGVRPVLEAASRGAPGCALDGRGSDDRDNERTPRRPARRAADGGVALGWHAVPPRRAVVALDRPQQTRPGPAAGKRQSTSRRMSGPTGARGVHPAGRDVVGQAVVLVALCLAVWIEYAWLA